MIKNLVNKIFTDEVLPGEEMSTEPLPVVDNTSESKKPDLNELQLFIKAISHSTDFKFEGELEASDMLQQLASELVEYIQSSNGAKRNDPTDKGQVDKDNVTLVLTEMINRLTLPGASKKEQVAIAGVLSSSGDNNKNWKNVTQKLVKLVNKSICAIEQEKRELASYAAKIDVQLENIESFIHEIRRYSDEKKSPAQALTDAAETTDRIIESTVAEATESNASQQQLSENPDDTGQHVEASQHDDVEKEELSAQSYAEIMEELSRSQMESKKLKEQLHTSKIQLLRDPLTNIPNTLAFDERVDVEFHRWKRHKSPLCLAIWDMDHFKAINENYGHDVGDQILKVFADIIHTRVRKVDLFARIGGEEFALLMPDTPMDMALMLNEKLRVMVEQCDFQHEGKPVAITSSVGLAEFQQGDEIISVLQRADQALYWSKHDGRNKCTVFKNKK